jgi:nucleotide-binding universal stress UspA family protein
MYSRILVAIDGSPAADVALTEAVRVASAHRAALRIAHVIAHRAEGSVEDAAVCGASADSAARAGRAMLAEAAAFAKKAGLTVEIRLLEIEGDQRIVDVLAEEAKAWPADLVVLGTHGRRPPNRFRLGSVAEALALTAPEPVLLVSAGHSE